MKNFCLIAMMLLFTTSAYAEKVRVYTDYSPVRILKLIEKDADFDLEAEKAGLKGNFKETDSSTIPKDRADRDAWKFASGKIVVDAKIKAEMVSKEDAKKSAIEKLKALGLMDDELLSLGIKGGE